MMEASFFAFFEAFENISGHPPSYSSQMLMPDFGELVPEGNELLVKNKGSMYKTRREKPNFKDETSIIYKQMYG